MKICHCEVQCKMPNVDWTELHVCQSPHEWPKELIMVRDHMAMLKSCAQCYSLLYFTLPSFNVTTSPPFDSLSCFLSFSSVRCHKGTEAYEQGNEPSQPTEDHDGVWTWVRDHGLEGGDNIGHDWWCHRRGWRRWGGCGLSVNVQVVYWRLYYYWLMTALIMLNKCEVKCVCVCVCVCATVHCVGL